MRQLALQFTAQHLCAADAKLLAMILMTAAKHRCLSWRHGLPVG